MGPGPPSRGVEDGPDRVHERVRTVVSAFQALRSMRSSRSPSRYSRIRRVHTSSRECRNWNEPAICLPLW